jgi:3-phenylpropionate/cinnamic acid dioxygenase small subunit
MDSAQRVRNLLGEYCERMDLGDFDGVGALFADAALADEHGAELARGAGAVSAFFRAGTQLHDGSPRTKHLVLNTILDVDDAAGTATARSSYLVLQATAGTELRPIITGRYRDTFVRGGTGWRFSERRFLVDLVGDLSAHLRFDLPDPA